MKKSLIAALTLATCFGAQAEFSANVGATSDYLWRGLTQSDGPAISGGLDYAHDSGIYVGTWASNVDFGDDTSYEIDFYGGFAGEVGDFGYDVGYIYYAYPDAGFEGESYDGDFGELYTNINWQWFGISASYGINADDDVIYDKAFYIEANVAYEISETLSISAAIGQQSFDEEIPDEVQDYLTYYVALTKVTEIGDFTFMFSDTDSDNVLGSDDPRVSVSWAFAFDL